MENAADAAVGAHGEGRGTVPNGPMKQVVSRRVRLPGLVALAFVVLLGATGCYEKLNGGGWMRSADGVDRANFAVSYDLKRFLASDRTDFSLVHLRGTYHDGGPGVRLKYGEVSFAVYSPGEGPRDGDCAYFVTSYESQERNRPGGGEAEVRACDAGEPGHEGDNLEISLSGGPYDGYRNAGPVLGGNFKGFQSEALP